MNRALFFFNILILIATKVVYFNKMENKQDDKK